MQMLPSKQEESAKEGHRKKTYKREVAVLVFSVCLGWSMYTGDKAFLDVTFIPTIFLLASALGLHEVSTNMRGGLDKWRKGSL